MGSDKCWIIKIFFPPEVLFIYLVLQTRNLQVILLYPHPSQTIFKFTSEISPQSNYLSHLYYWNQGSVFTHLGRMVGTFQLVHSYFLLPSLTQLSLLQGSLFSPQWLGQNPNDMFSWYCVFLISHICFYIYLYGYPSVSFWGPWR